MDAEVDAPGTKRRMVVPKKSIIAEKLIETHAVLTVVGSAWEALPGAHRLRLLQQAHALDPLVRRLLPERCQTVSLLLDEPIVRNQDLWRVTATAMAAELAVKVDQGRARDA